MIKIPKSELLKNYQKRKKKERKEEGEKNNKSRKTKKNNKFIFLFSSAFVFNDSKKSKRKQKK